MSDYQDNLIITSENEWVQYLVLGYFNGLTDFEIIKVNKIFMFLRSDEINDINSKRRGRGRPSRKEFILNHIWMELAYKYMFDAKTKRLCSLNTKTGYKKDFFAIKKIGKQICKDLYHNNVKDIQYYYEHQ